MSSKRYPEEFKIEAVKQVTEKGHSVADVAARLGTTSHSLYGGLNATVPTLHNTKLNLMKVLKFVDLKRNCSG